MTSRELILPIVEEENPCLPLSVNVVSKYWNVDLPFFEAQELVKKYPKNTGSVLIEGIELAEKYGLTCCIFSSSLKELKQIIDAGIPPIVILPGIKDITQHASIISGYDDVEKTILHYVPKTTEEGTFQGAIPEYMFVKKWSQEGNVLILLASPETMSSLDIDDHPEQSSLRACLNSERELLQKNTQQAQEFLENSIKENPNPTAYLLLAGLQNEKNLPECTNTYQKCLELNDKCFLAYRGLGNYFLKSQKFEDAEKNYSKAVEIDKERSATIFKNRAYVREKLGKNMDAKEDLKSYIKLFPNAPDRGIIEQAIREL